MEAEEEVVASSGFPIRSDVAQEPFSLSLPRQQDGPSVVPTVTPSQHDGPTTVASAHLHPPPQPPLPAGVIRKKRGRPRKYGFDGSVVALSPTPISASIPIGRDSSGAGPGESVKKKKPRKELGRSVGEKIAYLVGANFTPHVLTVNPGEDVTMKIISFSQQASQAVCVLSANGTISNVTLRRPTSLGSILTYEGRFEILSLSGSYTPLDNRDTVSTSGGMSVSLARADGHVVGGGLGGLLVAASPVQVVLGSFLPGHQLERKPKKKRVVIPTSSTPPVITNISTQDESLGHYGGDEPITCPASAFTGEAPDPSMNTRNTTRARVSFDSEESNGLVS